MTTAIIATSPVLTLGFVQYHPQRFLGYNLETGKIEHIIGLTTRGYWLSDRGYLYPSEVITNDLTEYARQQMEDARDLAETQDGALDRLCDRYDDGRDEQYDPHLDAFV